jgi:hypothetical protein
MTQWLLNPGFLNVLLIGESGVYTSWSLERAECHQKGLSDRLVNCGPTRECRIAE